MAKKDIKKEEQKVENFRVMDENGVMFLTDSGHLKTLQRGDTFCMDHSFEREIKALLQTKRIKAI